VGDKDTHTHTHKHTSTHTHLQVLGAEVVGDKVQLKVEASKGGKPETMEADVVLVSIGEPQ